MKIALVGAEIEENLALRSIGSSLEHAHHQVFFLDFHELDQADEVARAVVRVGANVVGLSMVFTARSLEFTELARAIRERRFAGHMTAGGHFASLHAEQLLKDNPALDSVIHGDGEEPMVELVEHLDRPEDVCGLTFRDESGRVISTDPRPNLDDLDQRPWPVRPPRFHAYLGKPIANLLSSRGCYAKCAFCSIDAFHRKSGGKRFRQRRIEAVADEMADLYDNRGVRIFNFQDDNFFVPSAAKNMARFTELGRALEERGVEDIALQAKGRPDCIDEDVIGLLQRIGLFRLFLGVETDAVSGLKTLGRGMERHHNHRALDILRRHQIHACFNLLIFDPDSTFDSLRTNVDFMRRQSYFPLNFCRVEVYGGTPMEARLSREGRLLGDYRGYTYRISDVRMQQAYEMFRRVFWPRNFSFDGTHFRSMKLDYNLHLLRHFYPERVTGGLEKRCKGLVHELNRHSASLMTNLLDFFESGQGESQADVDAFTRQLECERLEADESIGGRMNEQLSLIDDIAARRHDRRQFLQTTAAAAALAVAVPSCRNTHMCEAPPPPDHDTHMCEAPPPPEPIPELTPQQSDTLRNEVQSRIYQTLWAQNHTRFGVELTFELRLFISPTGQVDRCSQQQHDTYGIGQVICEDLHQRPPQLPFLSELDPSFSWYRTWFELEWRPAPQIDDTHMCEMAPMPEAHKGPPDES